MVELLLIKMVTCTAESEQCSTDEDSDIISDGTDMTNIDIDPYHQHPSKHRLNLTVLSSFQ